MRASIEVEDPLQNPAQLKVRLSALTDLQARYREHPGMDRTLRLQHMVMRRLDAPRPKPS